MHENHLHYIECLRTMRNHGLYLADQSLGGNTARFTRQNPRGNRRHGLECPEERDYYPYWRKQPWKDIAILVSNTSFCEFFQTQSQNVRTYGRCQCPDSENECPFLETVCTSRNYTWVTDPSHGLKAPDCLYHPFTRDNHLGNSYEVDPSTGDFITPKPGSKPMNPHYKLTIPQDMAGKMCVIRLRYNISTNDYPSHAYADKSNAQCNYKERDGVRYDDPSCGRGTGVKADQNCPFVIGQTVCPLPDGANAVGNPDCDSTVDAYTSPPECYPLITEFTASSVPRSNRPFINLFDRDISAGAAFKLGFAVNTHQTARTFQDRSYVFRVAEAPVNASISNLGVRGRRGNIVQAYPAVEYDFVPSVLRCAEGDYIHIQFHGSDFNTARNQNNAEGWQYSDRTNIVRINSSSVNYPVYQEGIDFFNETEAVFFGWGGQDPTYCDRSIEDDDSKQNQFTNCGKLNMMPNRFPQDPAKGLKQCNARPGSYYHMSTRNNNFSNRVQKVLIIVQGPDTTAPTSSPVTLTPTSGSSASGNKKNDGLSTNAEIGISFATIIFIGFAAAAVTLYVKKKELWCFKKTIPEQPSVVSLQNFHPDGELGETINPPIST
uniref:Uncharacterized protein n=1 Tax=Amorphochlora amoebiformis TaxID=1561963 RepID=A0A7S0H0V7_9EUKA